MSCDIITLYKKNHAKTGKMGLFFIKNGGFERGL